MDVLNADVIGITESWATSQILDSELSLSGFHMFRNDRKSEEEFCCTSMSNLNQLNLLQ